MQDTVTTSTDCAVPLIGKENTSLLSNTTILLKLLFHTTTTNIKISNTQIVKDWYELWKKRCLFIMDENSMVGQPLRYWSK